MSGSALDQLTLWFNVDQLYSFCARPLAELNAKKSTSQHFTSHAPKICESTHDRYSDQQACKTADRGKYADALL